MFTEKQLPPITKPHQCVYRRNFPMGHASWRWCREKMPKILLIREQCFPRFSAVRELLLYKWSATYVPSFIFHWVFILKSTGATESRGFGLNNDNRCVRRATSGFVCDIKSHEGDWRRGLKISERKESSKWNFCLPARRLRKKNKIKITFKSLQVN